MPEYQWPEQGKAAIVGSRQPRTDGLLKATGAAKYAYDINLPKMLFAHVLTCPHGHAKLTSIDTAAAKKVAGVVAVKELKAAGAEIQWAGDIVAVVAAESDGAAAEGVKAIKAVYEVLQSFVTDEDVMAARAATRTAPDVRNVKLEKDADSPEAENAEFERLLKESAASINGYYGIQAITHCCLETHGSTAEWSADGKLTSHLSTQNVSGTAGQFTGPLKIAAGDVTVHCDFIGGGFGSKFQADVWGIAAAEIARETGRPVKLMLDRRTEQEIGGNRPSGFVEVKAGADKDGVVKVFDARFWTTAGPQPGGSLNQAVVPYVIDPPNRRRVGTPVLTNTAPQRAWRAPSHPQGCAITQTVFDDIAAKLGLNSLEVFERNLVNVNNNKPGDNKSDVYREQLKIAAELIGWKQKWHLHGKGDKKGSVVTGLGIGLHTWGGGGHPSKCLVKVHPDGGVEVSLGSQDLGTGTRTCIGMVAAETFGLGIADVKVNIGLSKYPESGPSGGSTTIGGVSESTRRATTDALDKIFDLVAPKLGVEKATLVATNGKIQSGNDATKSMSWKQACALLGMGSLEVTGEFARGQKTNLSSAQVAGVQMAEVAVDLETGVVKMLKFVAVQDMGLIVNRLCAESQIYGAVIMGIAYSLFEERIMDPATGRFVNAGLADYKLPRLKDVGDIVVHLHEPASEYKRGVIGLGEPPVIAPGAAISNAVCNATGVRVPVLPLTPGRVTAALKKAKA